MPSSLPPLSHIPDILYAQGQTYHHAPYHYNNAHRQAEGGIVIQQTLRGSMHFADDHHDREVHPGEAVLFRHGESSAYGLGPHSLRPYETAFIAFTPGGGAAEIVNGIRNAFGPILRMAPNNAAALLLARAVEDFTHNRMRDRLELAEQLYRLLLALQREQMTATRGHDPIAYGRHLLETRYRSPRTIQEWASEIGITREHFSRGFRERHGESPAAFLRRLRLDHARDLLHSGHARLEDIAAASGFASPRTFHRAYKRRFGSPPRADTPFGKTCTSPESE